MTHTRYFLLLAVLSAFSLTCSAQGAGAVAAKDATRADELLAKMTLDEKIAMICGTAGGDSIAGVARLGIPALSLERVSSGALRSPLGCGMLAAATWNRSLARLAGESDAAYPGHGKAGAVIATDAGIYTPSNRGRNSGNLGEDPYLAGEMLSGYVAGVQSAGSLAALGFFATNEYAHDNTDASCNIDSRTLNELYLTPFRKAILQTNAAAVISSGNKINGQAAAENQYLNNAILRRQWGFKGLLLDGGNSASSVASSINYGPDVETARDRMRTPQTTMHALAKGLVSESTINLKVRHILETMSAFGLLDKNVSRDSAAGDSLNPSKVALQLAQEGITLLKNADGTLPLRKEKFAVVCPPDFNTQFLSQALRREFGKQATIISASNFPADTAAISKKLSGFSTAVVVVGYNSNDSASAAPRSFNLPAGQNELVALAASKVSNVVVVACCGSDFNMMPWVYKVKGIIMAWYPGEETASALAQVLSGKINPSGKLPITIGRTENDLAASDSTTAKGKKNEIFFGEGLMTGYRGYEWEGRSALFPFGFGLSYTSFAYSDIKAFKTGQNKVRVTFKIRNTGNCDGLETAQVYVSLYSPTLVRPVKELKGFEKVLVRKGETVTVTINLDEEAFSYYDVNSESFVVDTEGLRIMAGPYCDDLPLQTTVSQ